jgi:hypothetical protein
MDVANSLQQELDDIFNSPNPRNASLIKRKIATDSQGNILEVEKL